MSNTDLPDGFGLTEENKKFYRDEAFKLYALKRKLEAALDAAKQVDIEFEEVDFKKEISKQILFIDSVFARSVFTRSIISMPWHERFLRSLYDDAFLRISVISTFAGMTAAFISDWRKFASIINDLFSRISTFLLSNAHADTIIQQAQNPVAQFLPLKEIIEVLIVSMLPIGFLGSCLILAISDKDDSRRLASDTIKTLFGFSIGVATNLLK